MGGSKGVLDNLVMLVYGRRRGILYMVGWKEEESHDPDVCLKAAPARNSKRTPEASSGRSKGSTSTFKIARWTQHPDTLMGKVNTYPIPPISRDPTYIWMHL